MISPYATGAVSATCVNFLLSRTVSSLVDPAQIYLTSGFRVITASPGELNFANIATRLPAGTSVKVAVYLVVLQLRVPDMLSFDVGLNQSFQ
jgi:hypothetical protein